MQKCWKMTPTERPSFSELQESFAGMLLQEVNYIQLSSLTDGIYTNFPAPSTTRWEDHVMGGARLVAWSTDHFLRALCDIQCDAPLHSVMSDILYYRGVYVHC